MFTVHQEDSYCFKENLSLVLAFFYDISLTRNNLQQSALRKGTEADDNLVWIM